jgi:hypothetical protein
MRYGVDSFSPSSWEPQEEGMMNIAARFSLSKKQRFIDPKGKKPIRLKVMSASLRQLRTIYRAHVGAKLTWEYVVDVGAYSSLIPGNDARKRA